MQRKTSRLQNFPTWRSSLDHATHILQKIDYAKKEHKTLRKSNMSLDITRMQLRCAKLRCRETLTPLTVAEKLSKRCISARE